MKKLSMSIETVLSIALLMGAIVYATIYTYTWYSQTYTVTESGLSSISGIDGDLIINHAQTVYAQVTNNRATPVQANVTVNINSTNPIINIYPRTGITISAGNTWTMPNQTWTPTQTGDYTIEIVFEED